MKVAITGHTSGLGKALHEFYPGAMVFSRSNGFNIKQPESIALKAHDCDVFINNAHDGFCQVQLLYILYNLWKHHDKTIVCISSNSADGTKDHPNLYSTEKRALDHACEQLNNIPGTKCKIVCIKPEYIDTPRVGYVQGVNKIETKELAQFIFNLINMRGSFWIPKITIHPN